MAVGHAVKLSVMAPVKEPAAPDPCASVLSRFEVLCHHESVYSAILALRRATSSGDSRRMVASTRASRMCSSSSASP
eukprot:scaffold15102_cov101-Isochrysis_galbana.AAC.1